MSRLTVTNKRIISISRRTDIPAFYGEWFMNRLEEGFAGWENPFNVQKIITSLKPDDVMAFVFWSKNYRPFIEQLKKIKESNIPVMLNYTITGLPNIFECNLVEAEDAIESLKEIGVIFSPEHINWRYDPIVVSNVTDENYHLEKFRWLAKRLAGHVTRCYFSFAIMYGKVERNFKKFEQEQQIKVIDLEECQKLSLASKLTDIAQEYGIQMYTCCGDYLRADPRIKKAHCVDGEILEQLYPGCHKGSEKPTRKECGCTESTDIGKYDTCPHGCIYCYANINKERAVKLHREHDSDSAFLGFTKVDSDKCIAEIAEKERLKAEERITIPKKTKKLSAENVGQMGLGF